MKSKAIIDYVLHCMRIFLKGSIAQFTLSMYFWNEKFTKTNTKYVGRCYNCN